LQAQADGGLPTSRRLAAQEILLLDDGRQFQDLLTFDGKVATVLTRVPDMPAQRVAVFLKDVEAWVQAERPRGYRASVTGILAISSRVYEILLKGALKSFLAALLVTFLVFAFVLRSARLAIIGIIPNAAPVLLMFGFMALFGIDLKPSTVLLFSMVLVIADDDTIQYLARYRRRFREIEGADAPDPHSEAALGLLRELGLPMFITSTSVAAGFLLLCFSRFRANAQFGLIAGVTLFAAVFADLFLIPLIIRWWRPRLGRRRPANSRFRHG
jgi:predicted RND superfamily exporter protein